jgi:hypothetical protein
MQRRDLLKLTACLGLGATSLSLSRAFAGGVTAGDAPVKRVFTDAQRRTVKLLSDMIIPPTDTPGAVDAGVPDFIEIIYGEWYREGERASFSAGLADLDAFCQAQSNVAFNNADEALRVAALQEQERLAGEYKPPASGKFYDLSIDENTPFFSKLKELVVLGYYTSEVGATQELVYLPMPGHYDGAYDFSRVGRSWSS